MSSEVLEPGYFDAMSARGRCAAGEFVLCGRTLKPFSFRHSLALDASGNRLWTGTELADEADFLAAAVICSSTDFVRLGAPTADDLAAYGDLNAAAETWMAYIRTCYGSRPKIVVNPGAEGSSCKAPMEEFVMAFILRHSSGYTREWLETAPIGMVIWIFEAIGEQIAERSRIDSAADQAARAAQDTPAARRARAKREKTAGEIMARVKDPRKRLELLKALSAGTLGKRWRSEVGGRKSGKARKRVAKGLKRPRKNEHRQGKKGRKA